MTPTLPQSLVISGTVYIQHFRSDTLVIYQSYTGTTPPTAQPLAEPFGGVIQGRNEFHLFQVEHVGGGEQLGAKLGTFNDLNSAITSTEQITPQ